MLTDDRQPGRFDSDPDVPAPDLPREGPAPGVARVRLPNRTQWELRPSDLDALWPAGHRARVVWAWVAQADLSRMYAGIRAVAGGAGAGRARAGSASGRRWRGCPNSPRSRPNKAQQGQSRTQARASTTAAAATVMKMGEGGCRPAYKGH